MKKYSVLLVFSVLLFSSCEENMYIDPTLLPDETASGKNTFGCLVDGWVYTGGRYSDWNAIYQPIDFSYNPEDSTMVVNVKVTKSDYIRFVIINPVENGECEYTDARFKNEELGNGTVRITRFDKNAQIVSGTFSGERITFGRFDVAYQRRNDIPF